MTEPPRSRALRVVVVGTGHAGTTVAALLRQGGYAGTVTLLGDEPDPPYHRPPLSKKVTGDELEQWLRPAHFYRAQGIELRLNERVVAVDRTERHVTAASGSTYPYDYLVLATGAAPRGLAVPGADLGGVVTLRTLDDARELRDRLKAGTRLVVIGGGYLGLEVAAAARTHGLTVTVIERESCVLARVASSRLSQTLTRHHEARGTTVITNARITHLEGKADHVTAVHLTDARIDCDVVLVGIGATPRDTLAETAGLHCDGGIIVDGRARTSDPRILAVGDATRRPVNGMASGLRLESIPSATEQAKQACSVILGTPAPSEETPWFWSDQFDLKLKIAGVLSGPTEVVVRGDPDSDRFALFHHQDRVVTVVEAVNSAAAFAAGKNLISRSLTVDPARLADVHSPISESVLK